MKSGGVFPVFFRIDQLFVHISDNYYRNATINRERKSFNPSFHLEEFCSVPNPPPVLLSRKSPTQSGQKIYLRKSATSASTTAPEYKYFSTRNYHRAADIMLRVSYMAVQSYRISLLTSVLPIYHMQNDTYEEPDGDRVTLSGSQGLTLNLNVVLKYYLTKSQSFELNVGAPAAARSVRPDGLSKFAIGIGYRMLF